MLVTPSGISIDLKDEQDSNALLLMLLTLFGIFIDFKLALLPNAHGQILVTPSGITTLPEQVSPSIKILFTITSGFYIRLFSNHGVS
ncbi:MAG: hypothetical protein K2N49_04800 [Ruminococcus sp.]|nr:hypothetical protein [Ruminococcus sp.]